MFALIAVAFAAVRCTVPSENFKLALFTNDILPASIVNEVCITLDPIGVVCIAIRVPRLVGVKFSAASMFIRRMLPAYAPALVQPWLVILSIVSLPSVCAGASTVPRAALDAIDAYVPAPNASILNLAGLLSCAVKCNKVPVKFRGCTLPDSVPTTLNADSVVSKVAGVKIFVRPVRPTVNACNPVVVLATAIGRLNFTKPVAPVVPTIISRVESLMSS